MGFARVRIGKPIAEIKSKLAIEISAPESRVPRDDAEDIEDPEDIEEETDDIEEINSGSHRDALKTCKSVSASPVLSTRDPDRGPSRLPYTPVEKSSERGGGG